MRKPTRSEYVMLLVLIVLVGLLIRFNLNQNATQSSTVSLPPALARTQTAIANSPSILDIGQSAEINHMEITLQFCKAQPIPQNQQTITCRMKMTDTDAESVPTNRNSFVLRGVNSSAFVVQSTTLPDSLLSEQAVAGDIVFTTPANQSSFILAYAPMLPDNIQATWHVTTGGHS